MVIELPQGYYRVNFIELIDYVFGQYQDLLNLKENDFYQKFQKLGESAQSLYVRMLTRKGFLFRAGKLSYQEIPDTLAAAAELSHNGFITINPSLETSELLGLFSKPEWLSILASIPLETKPFKALKRAEFDLALTAVAQQHQLVTVIDEAIFQLQHAEHFETFKLLFFGNLEQDLTEFILRDLGLYCFENYQIDKQTRLFTNRGQIEQHLDYYRLLEDLEDILAQDGQAIVALHQKLPDAALQDKTLNRRIQRMNLTLARQLERLNELDHALMIYDCCQLPPARERCARILVKQQKIESALALCLSLMTDSQSDEEAVFATEFGHRTAKKHQKPWPEPVKYKPVTETITLVQSGQGVEADVASHFDDSGHCFFVENGLFCSVFGLHYWQLLFAPVRGAFTNPFQFRPHDLYDSEFVASRQVDFDKAQAGLADINSNDAFYLARWQEKYGTASSFAHWDILNEALLSKALACIPAKHWQKIFARMWADLRSNCSGFPDLILFPEAGGYELIEVKGPGDRLQKNQLRWMAYFQQHGIPHRVVHVQWS